MKRALLSLDRRLDVSACDVLVLVVFFVAMAWVQLHSR